MITDGLPTKTPFSSRRERNSKMKTLISTILGSFALIAACSTTTASAQDSRSLYLAADQYRDAMVHFEDEARRVPSIDRFTLRMIDRLEDQTSELRSATWRVTDLSRVLYEFNEIQSLHPRVEDAVFGSGCPIVRAALGPCWNEATIAYQILAGEIQRLQTPAYSSGFRGSHCAPSVRSPGFSSPFAPAPRIVPAPRIAPIPQFPPQASFRVPSQDFRGNHARQRSSQADLGNLIFGSILSRVARGL